MPPEYDSEVRSEIASSSIRRPFAKGGCGEKEGTGRLLENPSRILSRGCRHGRSNERSYLHFAIFFFPFFTIPFCSLGIVLPSAAVSPPFSLTRKECSIMQKCARESFAAGALVSTKDVSELILTRRRRGGKGLLMQINSRRIVKKIVSRMHFFASALRVFLAILTISQFEQHGNGYIYFIHCVHLQL